MSRIRIRELFMREGLQALGERGKIGVPARVNIIEKLLGCGVDYLEVTSYVPTKRLPQFSGRERLLEDLPEAPVGTYGAWIPNMQGLRYAIKDCERGHGVDIFEFLVSMSAHHSTLNTGCSPEEVLSTVNRAVTETRNTDVEVGAYIGAAFGFEKCGQFDPSAIKERVVRLLDVGCDHVILSDTTGVSDAYTTEGIVGKVVGEVGGEKVGIHCHDHKGRALSNSLLAARLGVQSIDTSASGIGGRLTAMKDEYPVGGQGGNLNTLDLCRELKDETDLVINIDYDCLLAAVAEVEGVFGGEHETEIQ